MENLDPALVIYCLVAIILSGLAWANCGFELEISASGSFSGILMVLGAFSLFYLLARII